MAQVPGPPAGSPDGGFTPGGGGAPPPGGWPNPQLTYPLPQTPNGVATAALVCGIVALVTGIIPVLFLIAVPVGVAAIITGAKGIRRARSTRRGRGRAVAGLVTGTLGILAVVGWAGLVYRNEDLRTAATELLRHGTLRATGQVWSNLAPGDCLDELLAVNPLGTVETVPCHKLHVFEVYAAFEYPEESSTHPGTEALNSDGIAFCEGAAFTDYVGVDYLSSRYDVQYIVPDERSWQAGRQHIVCVLHEPGEQRTIGSARLSGV